MTTTVTVHAHNHPTIVTICNRHAPVRHEMLRDDQSKIFTVTDTQAVKVFEASGKMDFGQAIDLLKAGEVICRVGWNGKGMFLFLAKGIAANGLTPVSAIDGVNASLFEEGPTGIVTRLPYISMHTATGANVPWLASQTDMLAEDWQVVTPADESGE